MLTAKQHQTYQFIRHYILKFSYAPTEAEIATGIGIKSRGVVHRYISALSAAGYLEVIPNKRRNIRLTEQQDMRDLPILGTIAAGSPIEAMDDVRSFNLSDRVLGSNRFILEVKGDSMMGDNICDGDYIVCESAQRIDAGEIVIALIDQQEVTLKRYRQNSDHTVTLIPSNPDFSPQVYAQSRIHVQGKYVGLLRFP